MVLVDRLWGPCCVRLMPFVGVLVLLLGCVSSVFCLQGVFLWCLFLLRLVVLLLSVAVPSVPGVVLFLVLLFFLMVGGFVLLLRSLLRSLFSLRAAVGGMLNDLGLLIKRFDFAPQSCAEGLKLS